MNGCAPVGSNFRMAMSCPSAPPITRRGFLKGLAGCTGGLAVAGFGYMRWLEPSWLASPRHTLTLPAWRAATPLRIAHLSDLHASPVVPYRQIERAIIDTLASSPDLICLTGDFVTRELDEPDHYARLLRRLSQAAPTFAVLGNHDGGAWSRNYGGQPDTRAVRRVLDLAEIQCLHNRSVTIELHGQPLHLVGVGDWWAGQLDARLAFGGGAGRQDELPTVVLSHNPDTKEALSPYPWDLLLSGHTHGGQLSLPLLGTPFAPVHDHRYVHGLKPWRDRWIHVTSGVGNLHGLRLGCRPEVSLIDITPQYDET